MSKNKMKHLVIIAPLPNLSERVRLNKLVHLLKNYDDLDIKFWGWDRGVNSGGKDFEFVEKKLILKGGGEGNKKLLLWYVIWMIRVFWHILVNRNKNSYFYCLGFESAFPTSIVSLISKRKFIYDNTDNISKSYNWPKLLYKIIESLENFTAKYASIHLVPGNSRVEKIERNTRIIPNTPASFLLDKAKKIAFEKGYNREGIFTVYINGYLTKARGLEQIYNAIKEFEIDKIKVIVAGYLRSESAEKLIDLPNVEYFGVVSNEESLALYFRSHLCITFYEPTTKINILAEPNKWGDCIATNTPFLVNSEILTARYYLEKGVCFGIPFYEYEEMINLFKLLSDNISLINDMVEKIKNLEVQPWDNAMKELIDEFIS